MSDVFDSACPAREVLEHLTRRWSVLIMSALRDSPHRYFELRRRVEGISDKMLSKTLQALIADGLLARTVVPGQPPEVTYALTELGAGAAEALDPILDWIRINAEQILDHRKLL